jgi:hypothetical protein
MSHSLPYTSSSLDLLKQILQGGAIKPTRNPQSGGPGLHNYDPQRQGDPPIPPGTGYPL